VAIVARHNRKASKRKILRIVASASVAITERARKWAEGMLGVGSALNKEVGNGDGVVDRNAEPSEA